MMVQADETFWSQLLENQIFRLINDKNLRMLFKIKIDYFLMKFKMQ